MNDKTQNPSPIAFEIDRWSDLESFVSAYNEAVAEQGDGIGRIFGYASIIHNHSAEKPEASHDLPNEKAKLPGMEVAMNVYATGQYEFRGTTDLANGVHNIGLYAGLEPAQNGTGFAEGVNITVAPQDNAESFKAYVKREIGNLPGEQGLDDIIRQGKNGRIEITETGKEQLAALKGTEEDAFGLYKLQTVNVETEAGSIAPALSVATNEKSPFAAIGLTDKQAAHYIMDGQGYSREVDGAARGGEALAYLEEMVQAQQGLGMHQPRIEGILKETVNLMEAYTEFDKAKDDPRVADATLEALDGVSTRRPFEKDLVDRGTPDDAVRQANASMPKTAEDKISSWAGKVLQGEIENLRDALKKAAENGETKDTPAAPSKPQQRSR